MNLMHARSAPSLSAAVVLLGLLLQRGTTLDAQDPPGDGSTAAETDVDRGETSDTCTVTFYQLWGSDEKPQEKPPKGLEKLIPRLRKHTGRRSFRLAAQPEAREVRIGETLRKSLPQKYVAEWTLTGEDGRFALRQKLTNPGKRSSVLLFKKCPVMTELTKIRQESEFFILVVDFGPSKKK